MSEFYIFGFYCKSVEDARARCSFDVPTSSTSIRITSEYSIFTPQSAYCSPNDQDIPNYSEQFSDWCEEILNYVPEKRSFVAVADANFHREFGPFRCPFPKRGIRRRKIHSHDGNIRFRGYMITFQSDADLAVFKLAWS